MGRWRRRWLGAIATAVIAAPVAAQAPGGRPAGYQPDPRLGSRIGRLAEYRVADSIFRRERRVWIYTPPGFADTTAGLPWILAFDGDEYRDTMPLPRTLDSLVAAGAIPPAVAVLVDDSSGAARTNELGNAPRLVTFLAGQLVPWVRRGWRVTTDPARVVVTGSSAGGLAAAFLVLERPDLFGNAWSQSGAFWRGRDGSNDPPYEWLTSSVANRSGRRGRFVLDVGALEDHPTLGGSGPNFLAAHERFVAALGGAGYAVTATVVPEGNHAPQWWRRRLAGGLTASLSPGAHPRSP